MITRSLFPPLLELSLYSTFGNNPIVFSDYSGNVFTPSAQVVADKLSEMAIELYYNDKLELKLLKQRGMKNHQSQRVAALKSRMKEYKKVQKEIKKLQKSKQVYDVQYEDEADYDGKTWFDLNTGHVVMSIRKSGEQNELVSEANEFTHAAQFESGQLSLVSGGVSNRGGIIYDSYDEYISESRERLLSGDHEGWLNYTFSDYLASKSNNFIQKDYSNNNETGEFKLISTESLRPNGPLDLNSKNNDGIKFKTILKDSMITRSLQTRVFGGKLRK